MDDRQEDNPVLEAYKEQVDIVPYSRKEKYFEYGIIAFLIFDVLMIAAFFLPWKELVGG